MLPLILGVLEGVAVDVVGDAIFNYFTDDEDKKNKKIRRKAKIKGRLTGKRRLKDEKKRNKNPNVDSVEPIVKRTQKNLDTFKKYDNYSIDTKGLTLPQTMAKNSEELVKAVAHSSASSVAQMGILSSSIQGLTRLISYLLSIAHKSNELNPLKKVHYENSKEHYEFHKTPRKHTTGGETTHISPREAKDDKIRELRKLTKDKNNISFDDFGFDLEDDFSHLTDLFNYVRTTDEYEEIIKGVKK